MPTRSPFYPGFLLSSCVLVAVGCDPAPSSDDEGESDTESDDDDDDDSGDDDPSAADDDPTGADDDDDGADTSGGDTTDPSGGDTEGEGTPIGDDVFFYVREVDDSEDEVWAYDLATDTTQRVIAFDGAGGEVSSIAIHPDRSWIAVASDWNLNHYQQSESIYAYPIGEDLELGEASLVMEGLPPPAGASAGYSQQIDDLRFHPDGSRLWLGHAFFFDISEPGGGAIASLDLATGEFALHEEIVEDCTVNTGPSPSPDGEVLLVVQGVCIDDTHEGIVAFDVPLAGAAQPVLPSSTVGFGTPRWLPDGAGIAYWGEIDYDTDGDGMNDIFGAALLLLDLASGMQYALLPPAVEQYIWDFTMSPDGTRYVVCVSHEGVRDLLLVDYSGDEGTARWLTEDGLSCKPSW
jgi:hypothetical protein